MEIFKDANIIIGKRMSPNFVEITTNAKFQPTVVGTDKVSEIMKEVVKSFDKIYSLVKQRKKVMD